MLNGIKYGVVALSLTLCATSANAQMNPKYKFEEALKLIQDNYVDQTDDERLIDAAIQAMLAELDPHSQYVGREEAEAMRQNMSGSFAGIGVQFLKTDENTFITDVNPEGPALRAGIKVGDQVTAINGVSIISKELRNQDIMMMIRGEKGEPVTLTVKHPGESAAEDVTIIRENLLNRSVTACYMVDKEIGYIALSIFTESTRREMDDALKLLIGQGMRKLILDLQGNGGGYVQSAIGVADEFLVKEKLVFYSVSNTGVRDHYLTGGYGRFYEGEMVVLIDESTASSSEIVSGALQDWDRAVIVGRRSFGKGLMQKSFEMTDGSMLQLTGARYYTPSGRSIQRSYAKGKQEYFQDINHRLTTGELLEETTVELPDSLKYHTLVNKRTVYGGGGITPDKFVPADTAIYSNWMNRLMSGRLISTLTFQYVKDRRASLLQKYPTFPKYKEEYTVPDEWMNILTQTTARNNIALPATFDEAATTLIKAEIKAQIAGQLYTGGDFRTPILNEANRSYLEAIRILKNKKEYKQLLKNGNNSYKTK